MHLSPFLLQVELTGSSMFGYIHPEDQQDLVNVLQNAKEELESNGNCTPSSSGRYTDDIPFFGNQPGKKSKHHGVLIKGVLKIENHY